MFKNAGILYDHYEEIVKAIQDIGVFNSGKKKDAAIALLGRYAPEMAKLKEELKATDKRIEYLEGSVRIEKQNTAYFRGECAEKEDIIWEKNRQLLELNRKQKELERMIALIPLEVMEQLKKQELAARRLRNGGER
jgi:septal ring factor EnvC (AmiA/AmiB activator)